jgi:uncharacterized protein (DUF1697 family)
VSRLLALRGRYGVAVCASEASSAQASRQIALLRGVNVGGHNRVPMAHLRELLLDLGYEDVRTHLQSGNAVFTAGATPPEVAAQEIEGQLARSLGLGVRVLVRTAADLARVVSANPLPAAVAEPSRFLVTFLSAPPDPDLLGALDPADFEPELFGFGERELYVWCPEGVRTLKLSYAFLERRFGVVATARNWNTVTRLLALARE